ncbi:hypothetical protein ACFV7R_41805 [Streptomyces sp. NPDC059866]|uniref:hypothetical protein n=1 Tax=Streptomyces sp. NPDC059866 TaxID=3346978 RepID=UPI00365982DB
MTVTRPWACSHSDVSRRRDLHALLDVHDRQEGGGRRDAELTWRRPGWGGDVGESFQAAVEGGLAVVDGSLLVLGERMMAARLFCKLALASMS